MPRARNIKPGFFANEDLAEIEPIGRLLFIGLWTLADRDGRLEDRPKRIKGELFPYDNCDINALLDDLQKYGFIMRYEVDGGKYIQIVNFSKHQNPHPKEPSKDFPMPETCEQVASREKKLQASDKQVAKNADILNPDILNPESNYSDSDESQSPPVSEAGGRENVPYAEILEHYKRLCPSLPMPSKLSSSRKTQIKARWCNDLHRRFDELDAFLKTVEESDFLTGRNGARDKPFGIDWIFKQQNFLKIQEGNYANRASSKFSPCQLEPLIHQGDCTFGIEGGVDRDSTSGAVG
jgi:hypothetical protein